MRAYFLKFFNRFPEAQGYFDGTDMTLFGVRKFIIISDFLLDTLEHPAYAEGTIIEEVMRHQIYGMKDKSYYLGLIDVFYESIKESGHSWDESFEEHWKDATDAMKYILVNAAEHYLS